MFAWLLINDFAVWLFAQGFSMLPVLARPRTSCFRNGRARCWKLWNPWSISCSASSYHPWFLVKKRTFWLVLFMKSRLFRKQPAPICRNNEIFWFPYFGCVLEKWWLLSRKMATSGYTSHVLIYLTQNNKEDYTMEKYIYDNNISFKKQKWKRKKVSSTDTPL